jgi:hypothetical protein
MRRENGTVINRRKATQMALYNILLIVLILLVIGVFPAWPYSTGWGYYPTGGLGTLLIILIILRILGII